MAGLTEITRVDMPVIDPESSVSPTKVGAALTWAAVKAVQALGGSTSSVRSGGDDTLAQVRLARRCRPPMTAAGRGHHPSPPLTRSAPTDTLPPR
jgi:hypothetical protein